MIHLHTAQTAFALLALPTLEQAPNAKNADFILTGADAATMSSPNTLDDCLHGF